MDRTGRAQSSSACYCERITNLERRDGSVAELARIIVRRTATFGVAAFAAAGLVGLGAGTAAAEDLLPSCEASQGPSIENGVRPDGIQGELRSADIGQVLAQGSVNGDNSRVVGRADPGADAVPEYAYGGAIGDFSADTAALFGTHGFLSEISNPCG
jgi:hypothetical protein